jgi:hypothetical protein
VKDEQKSERRRVANFSDAIMSGEISRESDIFEVIKLEKCEQHLSRSLITLAFGMFSHPLAHISQRGSGISAQKYLSSLSLQIFMLSCCRVAVVRVGHRQIAPPSLIK